MVVVNSSLNTFVRRFGCILLPALIFPVVSLAAAPLSSSDCVAFSRNLRLGISGEDVLILQRLLNNDPATRVADSGAGSSGLETTYFGVKTRGAVMRFQDLYKGQVLSPAGLTTASGFVGTYTRAKLTSLCEKELGAISATPATSKPSSETSAVSTTSTVVATVNPSTNADTLTANSSLAGNSEYFHVKYPSSYVVHPGDKVAIYGGGFTTENNTLRIGTLSLGGLKATQFSVLEATIPTDAPSGKFDLWVENAKGVSNKSFIIITPPETIAPVIDSVTPAVTQIGKTITITGSGFTSENNEVHLSVSTITGAVSPDGKTLSFVFTVDIPGVTPELIPPGTTRDISIPISLYVINANGISNRATFTVAY